MHESEIKIYQSVWKHMLVAIACLGCAIGAWLMVTSTGSSGPAKVAGCVGVIFFGGGGLLYATTTLYNWMRHIPFFIIYENRVEIYQPFKLTYHTIPLADVKRFRLITINSVKFIAVDYTTASLTHKLAKTSSLKHRMMAFNVEASGGGCREFSRRWLGNEGARAVQLAEQSLKRQQPNNYKITSSI